MNKTVKILLWVLGILLGLIVLATLLVSPIAKSYVNSHGEELLGRKVHVDELKVNVYTGHLAIHRLSLYEDNGEDVFVSFDTLDVKARLLQLLGHTVHLKHITLSGLNVNVVKDGEKFNFKSLVDHFASEEPEEKDTTPSDWVMKFYNIRLSHAQIHYRDLREAKHWHLPDINLRVPGFVLGGDEGSQGGLNIGFADGGRLNIDAGMDENLDSYKLTATLQGFALKNIQPLVTDVVRLDKMAGTFEARLKAEGSLGEVMKSRIGGTLALRNVDLSNANDQVAAFNNLTVVVNNINLDDNSYDIASVKLDGFTTKYEQWSDHNTIDNLLLPSQPSQEQSPAATDTTPSKPLKLKVSELLVSHCNLTYADHTLPDDFVFPLTDLGIEASDITLSGKNNARLRAALPGGGHLLVNWKGNIDQWKQHQNLFFAIKGLDMKKLSPWTVYYSGQPIEDGIFSLTSRVNISNSQLDNQNKLDIFKAKVGSRRKDVEPQMKLPLKTALYILKDKDDKILIDMPVKGNIDSPEFNYMKLVWKTLGNLLVKVATSPIRALGNVMGMGEDNLDFIPIASNQRGLTSEQYHILADLAAIAKRDSLLSISLEQRMPAPVNDTVARGYAMRNEMVRRYLLEQGVRPDQLRVATGEPISSADSTGYTITSEMKLD